MRVLLIESDTTTIRNIELILKAGGLNSYTTDVGEEAVDLAKTEDYDIIVLDSDAPEPNGLSVLKSLRRAKIDTPVLILSSNVTVDAKVKALSAGADDYITKPFHKDEFIARIHAVIRRSKGHAESVITTGSLVVNLDSKTVAVGGTPVPQTCKEYQIVELLSLRRGSTLTKEAFMNHLYGGMDEPEFKIIDVFICKLRKKLASAPNGQDYIKTVWGRGYALGQPEQRAA